LGPVAEVILREARSAGADLIVLGRERPGTTRRHPLGSVTSTVIRGATCPVLVIPSAGRAEAHSAEDRTESSTLMRAAALDGAGQ
jgi:Universal stress protein family